MFWEEASDHDDFNYYSDYSDGDMYISDVLYDSDDINSEKNFCLYSFYNSDYGTGTSNYTPVFIAVHNGDLNLVNSLIDECSVDENCNGRSLMHIAAARGHDKIVSLLLQRNFPVNKEDNFGNSPLHLAINNNHSAVVNLLLNENTVNWKNGYNMTSLHFAVYSREIKFVEVLLKHGANPNEQDDHLETPLHVALHDLGNSSINIVKLLIEYGASLEIQDRSKNYPLHSAVIRGDVEMVKLFLNCKSERQFKLTNSGKTPLHYAAVLGNLEIVKLLIANGYGTVKIDDEGDESKEHYSSPLFYAIYFENLEVVKYLIENGSKVLKRENLLVSSSAARSLKLEIWNYLVKCSSIINRKTFFSQTELHYAVRAGNVAIVKEIVSRQNNQETCDPFAQKLAVHIAVEIGQEEILKILLEAGYSTESCFEDNGPLHVAATFDTTRLLEILLEAGADLNSKTKHDETALHFASFSGNLNTVKFLLNAGIEISKTSGSFSPLDSALKRGRDRCTVNVTRSMFENLLKITELLIIKSDYQLLGNDFLNLFSNASGILIVNEVEQNDSSNSQLEEKISAEVDCYNFGGRVETFCPDIVKCLLNYVNEDEINGNFYSLMQNAIHMRMPEVVNVLLEYNINEIYFKAAYLKDYDNKINLLIVDYVKSLEVISSSVFRRRNDNLFRLIFARLALLSQFSEFKEYDLMGVFDEKTKPFQEECFSEIISMKETKVCDDFNITYYDILSKPVDIVANYVNSSKLMEIHEIYMKFKFYGNFLNRSIQKAKQRKNLIDTCTNGLLNCFKRKYNIQVPILVIKIILAHLSVMDKQRLGAAFF